MTVAEISPSQESPLTTQKATEILESISGDSPFFMDDTYLRPSNNDDEFLLNIDSFISVDEETEIKTEYLDSGEIEALKIEIGRLRQQLTISKEHLNVLEQVSFRFQSEVGVPLSTEINDGVKEVPGEGLLGSLRDELAACREELDLTQKRIAHAAHESMRHFEAE